MNDDDMGDLLAPKSQQLDAVDLIAGDRTFTVKKVTKTGGEQPLNIFFEEFDRPWRPGVNQRRVLGNVWGTKFGVWAGRRLTLQCDPTVVYGGKAVGGIRVTHMSHIDKRTPTPIIPTRGQGAIYNVDPLKESAPALSPAETLRAEWKTATPERRAEIEAEVAALTGGAA